ncbi:MAG: rubredoxin [Syntrophobacteraceae bacterium]
MAAQRCVFARLQEKVPRRKYGASCRQETNVCGYVYDPVKGDLENGISPGTEFKACRVQVNCELMCIPDRRCHEHRSVSLRICRELCSYQPALVSDSQP